jgi:hypothetical protein
MVVAVVLHPVGVVRRRHRAVLAGVPVAQPVGSDQLGRRVRHAEAQSSRPGELLGQPVERPDATDPCGHRGRS